MEVHIGKEIERKYQESGLKLSEFAKRINTGTRNIYSIFSRKDISIQQLRKVSEVLNYNFFELYEQSLPSEIREPHVPYVTSVSSNKIMVLVELDGQQKTLHKTMEKLTAINQVI